MYLPERTRTLRVKDHEISPDVITGILRCWLAGEGGPERVCPAERVTGAGQGPD